MGFGGLLRHKLRSGLTALGVIFGVASVVAMLAVGEGASFEAQEQIRELGSHNIIIDSVKPPEDDSATARQERVSSYGIKHEDVRRICETIPTIARVAKAKVMKRDVRIEDRRFIASVVGVLPEFSEAVPIRLERGRWLCQADAGQNRDVCILGADASVRLFPFSYPLDRKVKIGPYIFRVVGVLSRRGGGLGQDIGSGVIASVDQSVYVPLPTMVARYGELHRKVASGSREYERVELHQLILQVRNLDEVVETAMIVEEILGAHHEKADFNVTIPFELLRQAEQTKKIFNIVLGSIAAISLVVGGIGIMNIMLASVTERTREIGIRRSLGARRRDIMSQFLSETVLLSTSGGLLGLVLGVTIPQLVTHFAGMKTIVTPISLALAFSISAVVGVVFGTYPASRASRMDPIEALRHE
jgi:putative ABC transport system permease protein